MLQIPSYCYEVIMTLCDIIAFIITADIISFFEFCILADIRHKVLKENNMSKIVSNSANTIFLSSKRKHVYFFDEVIQRNRYVEKLF